jgi:hypothetical protein
LKNNEEFRASVYARAEREKQRAAERRQRTRNACLSAAMLLLVAAIAAPLARNARGRIDPVTVPETATEERHAVNPAALGTRMVLLVGTQAVVLENEAQQKEFVNQYKAAINLGDGEDAPFPAADTAKAIHSTDELTEFLAELPEAAEAMRADYDEAFFEGNDLYAMPMELAAQPEAADPQATAVKAVTTQAATIPDAIVPETTIPDAARPPDEDGVTADVGETTSDGQTNAAMTTFPDSGLLQGADVRVLLLVPVNKG